MATIALTDASVTVGGTDLSDHVASVTLELSGEPLDDSAMGDTWRSRIVGTKDSTWTINFHQLWCNSVARRPLICPKTWRTSACPSWGPAPQPLILLQTGTNSKSSSRSWGYPNLRARR